jgi:phosphoglycolate phosphatase-like HAD superfamily hydrolase
MIKLLIFDFDGTIVDSKEVYYHSIRNHLYDFGFGKEAIDKTIDLGLNLGETLRRFVPSAITRWFVRRKIMHDVMQEASRVKKCHDAGHIHDIHTRKILVSNSLSEFVIPVLRHLKLSGTFREIYCADNFDDKISFISKYLRAHGIKPKECFYVGDRVADVKVAKKVGCHSAIISGKCSWNSKEELMKAKPDFIVPDLILLKRIIEKFRD